MRRFYEQNKMVVECFGAEYCICYIARNSVTIDECNSMTAGDFEM